MNIKNIKYGKLVGIGEASHGTKEYQKIRLDIIKYLHSLGPIQVFIEDTYPAVESIKIPNKTRSEFNKIVKKSDLFDFTKSDEFCKILWFLYKNKIPFYGVDIQINGVEKLIKNPIVDYILTFYKDIDTNTRNSNFRDEKMQELINILWDEDTRGIFLSHNYHISKYVGFTGTSIGFATSKGNVSVFDKIKGKFIIKHINYTDQQLHFSDNRIIKGKPNKMFYTEGFLVNGLSEMDSDKFDYIIYIKKTTTIKNKEK